MVREKLITPREAAQTLGISYPIHKAVDLQEKAANR